MQCSYLEVYNNTLNDLLGGKSNLPMREKPGTGTVVEGLTYEMVGSSREVMANLARATQACRRRNEDERALSRGHAIFTLYVKEILAYGGEKAGKLNLVDLAGMESSKRSYVVEGASNNEMRKIEAKNINTSLYALGSVIEALSRASQPGEKKGHVPYRDSKLTRLLQDSLGGNSKCTIVVALRIETQNIEESINTLPLRPACEGGQDDCQGQHDHDQRHGQAAQGDRPDERADGDGESDGAPAAAGARAAHG